MAARAITPPILQGPTAKEKKYDRQLRLWAASGQEALENASVLLLNSGSGVVGVETLKNLILPGIGNFTIVDGEKVQESDLGVNFFLTEKSLGKSRAAECCRYLNELNPDVKGRAIEKSIGDFVTNKDDWIMYTVILLIGPLKPHSGLSHGILETISFYADWIKMPLFYIHSVGFYSQFSVQLPSKFPIVDTHPDPVSTQDIRLLNPWPELLKFMRTKTKDLGSLSDHEHGHIPYLLLLLHFLENWKASHDGKPPESYQEKKAFKVMIEEGARRNNAEGGEENFNEAAAAVLKSLNPPSISSGVREVLESEDAKDLNLKSANFWLIAHAIHRFYSKHGVLPLPGALPDMKAQSADYIKLQNIYKTKARKDLAEIIETVRSVEKQLDRKAIEEKEIEAFCKGAAFTKLIHGRPIRVAGISYKRLRQKPVLQMEDRAKFMYQELQNEESLMPIYVAFLAYDWSTEQMSHLEEESAQGYHAIMMPRYCRMLLKQLTEAAGGNSEEFAELEKTTQVLERTKKVMSELARASGVELHNISALTGGMVAQEVIKVITKQYIPVDNTCVFDGITSKTAVFNM